jgi:hypothetical protein
MASSDFRGWRGYLYILVGLAFGIYRGLKVVTWTSWDMLDQGLALGMIAIGLFLILKK